MSRSWSLPLLLCASPALAATEPRELIEPLVAPLISSSVCVGLSVAAVTSQSSTILSYGRIRKDEGPAPTARTIFEIASITKVFTTLLLAEMAQRGALKLSDPVRRFLPPEALADLRADQRAITLLDLATHTSGLPSIPDNLALEDLTNPYAEYSARRLYEFLARCPLAKPRSTSYTYSNLGLGLLGHALARAAGKSYAALLAELITGPLGMADTCITLAPEQRLRLARGHDADAEPVTNWDFDALEGCGALRSTPRDMLRFLRAAMGLDATPLAAAFKASLQPRAGIAGGGAVGLGWHLGADGQTFWHNGQTGGYHSYIGFVPTRGVGVVILANSATMSIDDLGRRIRDALAGAAVKAPLVRTAIPLRAELLDGLVGRYEFAPNITLDLSRSGEQVWAQINGQPRFRVHAESALTFFARSIEVELCFERGAAGEVTGLVFTQAGVPQRARRLATPR